MPCFLKMPAFSPRCGIEVSQLPRWPTVILRRSAADAGGDAVSIAAAEMTRVRYRARIIVVSISSAPRPCFTQVLTSSPFRAAWRRSRPRNSRARPARRPPPPGPPRPRRSPSRRSPRVRWSWSPGRSRPRPAPCRAPAQSMSGSEMRWPIQRFSGGRLRMRATRSWCSSSLKNERLLQTTTSSGMR